MRFSALLNLVVIIYLQFSIDNFKLRELFSTRVNSELSRWPHLKLMLVCSYERVCVCVRLNDELPTGAAVKCNYVIWIISNFENRNKQIDRSEHRKKNSLNSSSSSSFIHSFGERTCSCRYRSIYTWLFIVLIYEKCPNEQMRIFNFEYRQADTNDFKNRSQQKTSEKENPFLFDDNALYFIY